MEEAPQVHHALQQHELSRADTDSESREASARSGSEEVCTYLILERREQAQELLNDLVNLHCDVKYCPGAISRSANSSVVT